MSFNSRTLLYFWSIVSLLLNLLLINHFLTSNSTSFIVDEDDIGIDFAFSGMENNPKTLLLDTINKAEETLDIAMYNFEDTDIAEAILEAKDRGVTVRLFTDEDKAKTDNNAAILDAFTKNGIEAKVNTAQKMHLKMVIIDNEQVVTGSYNFTEESAYENQEQLLTLINEEISRQWTDIYDELWGSRIMKNGMISII
ncbi:phospholipase D-like domain-containing protein [Salinibacillus aidingensis]|uniref:phospholipase D n=1 Tax=Salinibacillus aidingensis TaxID=237684 RepID=A0ABN1B2N8_9BACI